MSKDSEEGDTVEEHDEPDGTHVRKEIHQGPGFKTVRITSSGGAGGAISSPGGLMEMIMKDLM